MIKATKFYTTLFLILSICLGIYFFKNYQDSLATKDKRLQRRLEVGIQTDKFYVGKTIALLDVGVDWDNSELEGISRKEACFSSAGEEKGIKFEAICKAGDYAGAGQNCKDKSLTSNCSHGTQLASVVVGKYGIATGATLWSIQIYSKSDKKNVIPKQNYQKALDYLIAQKEKGERLDVINLSWNTEKMFENDCDNEDEVFTKQVAKLNNLGVKIVASSGNEGINGKIAFPSCVTGVAAIASKDNGTGDTKKDEISDFSNRNSKTILEYGKYITVSGNKKPALSYGTSLASAIYSAKLVTK